MVRKIAERGDAIPALAEIFREHGFEGASLAEITKRPGWFETNVLMPLRESEDPAAGIDHMFKAVIRFYHSGRRVCLVGTFALDDTRDRFASEIESYFAAWTRVLAAALKRRGFDTRAARETAEDVVAGIQGALVLARAHDDSELFMRAMKRLYQRTKDIHRDRV